MPPSSHVPGLPGKCGHSRRTRNLALACRFDTRQRRGMTTVYVAAAAGCAPMHQSRVPVEAAGALSRAFKALGDPIRLQLMSMIASAAEGEICVCDLAPSFTISGPTISH